MRRSLLRYLALLPLIASGVLSSGCGGSGDAVPEPAPPPAPPSPPPPAPGPAERAFLYVANESSGDITIFQLGSDGSLGLARTVAAGDGVGSVAIHPSGKFAYAVNLDADSITLYEVNAADGMLMRPETFATGSSPTQILVHPSGRFAFVSLTGLSGGIVVYDVDAATGALSERQRLQAGRAMTRMGMHASGKYVYFGSQGDLAVTTYEFDDTVGLLAVRDTEQAFANPFDIAVAPSGAFAYVANIFDFLTIYPIDPDTGVLASGTAVSLAGAYYLAIDPKGRFAYVSRRNFDRLEAFTIGQSGNLTSAGDATTASPGSVTVDPSGMHVYVANYASNTVTAYSINQSSGALEPLGTPMATGTGPSGIFVARLRS